jgi:hypothetical protein
MSELLSRHTVSIRQKRLGEDDHRTAVSRPLRGFGQGERDVVVSAALAAADAGKLSVHRGK